MALLYVAGLWFGATGCYVLVIHAKVLRDAGRLNLFWTINLLPWAVVGLTLDASFNATVGTLMFAELPREWLFSARVQRHYRGGGWRRDIASWWGRQLNQIDPTHIK